MDERKRREIDPTCQMLEECIAEAAKNPHTDEYTISRLEELRDFMLTMSNWYMQVRQWPTSTLVRFLKLGGGVAKLLRLGK
jgi:DNA-binding transcriptional regulator GbsR (MarR family)